MILGPRGGREGAAPQGQCSSGMSATGSMIMGIGNGVKMFACCCHEEFVGGGLR